MRENHIIYNNIESRAIDVLRFPLAIMVVFIHVNPPSTNITNADFSLFSAHGIYNLSGILFSNIISHIAVPTFFLISGYLFYKNFKEWQWDKYKSKIKKRFHSLLIPYILWNLLFFSLFILYHAIIYIKNGESLNPVFNIICEKSWHIFYDCKEWGTTKTDWSGNYLRMTGPYDLPLWFLRDLIVVTFISPLIFFLLRKLKFIFLLLLFVAYISRIWTQIPGLQISAVFFYSIGVYFAIFRINMIHLIHKAKNYILPVCLILLIALLIYFGGRDYYFQNLYPFFIISGVLSVIYIAYTLVVRFKIKANKHLISSCFFIYALHVAPIPKIKNILQATNSIMHKLIPGQSYAEDIFCYFTFPLLTVFICIIIYSLLKKLMPKMTSLLSGNR